VHSINLNYYFFLLFFNTNHTYWKKNVKILILILIYTDANILIYTNILILIIYYILY